MRTTVDLPQDLHDAVVSLAAQGRTSMTSVVEQLLRRGLSNPTTGGSAEPLRIDERTGLPVFRSPRPVTEEDVKSLDDE